MSGPLAEVMLPGLTRPGKAGRRRRDQCRSLQLFGAARFGRIDLSHRSPTWRSMEDQGDPTNLRPGDAGSREAVGLAEPFALMVRDRHPGPLDAWFERTGRAVFHPRWPTAGAPAD